VPLIINGQTVPEQVLRDEMLHLSAGLEMNAPNAGAIDPEHLKSAALRHVVRRTLLLQAAMAEGLRVTDVEIEAERARRWGSANNTFCGAGVRDSIAGDLLVQRISALLTRHVQRPGRSETADSYQVNHRFYFLPEAVSAAHVVCNLSSVENLVRAEEALKQAEAELARGKGFAQVADRFSDCKGVGGSIGWVTRGQMVPEFEEVVFALKPGERSGIFRTVFGLHIATVLKKRSEGYQPFEEVRLEIASRLFAERRENALMQAVAAMERASQIHYTPQALHG
jgi:peptidyl-prolyl cis-trans isomerase C